MREKTWGRWDTRWESVTHFHTRKVYKGNPLFQKLLFRECLSGKYLFYIPLGSWTSNRPNILYIVSNPLIKTFPSNLSITLRSHYQFSRTLSRRLHTSIYSVRTLFYSLHFPFTGRDLGVPCNRTFIGDLLFFSTSDRPLPTYLTFSQCCRYGVTRIFLKVGTTSRCYVRELIKTGLGHTEKKRDLNVYPFWYDCLNT